jgi:hypothetical protein
LLYAKENSLKAVLQLTSGQINNTKVRKGWSVGVTLKALSI